MSQIQTVFTTSGFVVPLTPYHVPYKEVGGLTTGYFSKMFASNSDQMLREYFTQNNVFISETAKRLYDNYTNDQSLENFMAIVDMVSELLNGCTPEEFFEWQMGSRHISNISVMFCLDVTSNRFIRTYQTYSVLGFNSRFVINNGSTAQEANYNFSVVKRHLQNNSYSNSWVHLLAPLMSNRAAFVTFFKHIFVDFY